MKNTSSPSRFAAALFLTAAMTSPALAAPFDEITKTVDDTLASYESVYIAPVQLDLPEDTRRTVRDIRSPRPVTERDQTRRAERLQRDLTRAFGNNFELVDAPGEDVLTVETTLTGLRSTRPTLADQIAEVQLDFGSTVYAGGADYAVRLSEADTVLVEIEESDKSNLNDGRPRVGTWQDADRSSRLFSSRLARYVRDN
ncbi:MAG: DUF3313 family protein [Pseudomonadota bacterium]